MGTEAAPPGNLEECTGPVPHGGHEGSTPIPRNRYGEFYSAGRVIVFTDGACRGNQWKRARAAGCGAFWAEDHPFNLSSPLEGDEQTNNRAELRAVLHVVQVEVRAVEIRTDSAYVHNGVTKYMCKWRTRRWRRKNRPMTNADLWEQLDTALQGRNEGSVLVTKVLAHATARDVLRGAVSAFDKWGNDNADALAVGGASRHPDLARRHERLQALRTVMNMHKMMVDILAAREERRRQPTIPEVVDISSDSDGALTIASSSVWSAADMEPD